MRRFRFRLGTLVILVLVIGVSFAALRESNENWESGVFTLVLTVLLVSVLLGVHRTEKRRAFWLGFALFGTTYLGLSLLPSIESRLITTKALAFMDSRVPRSMTRAEALYDLLVANGQPNALYLDKGNGTFQDVTASVGLSPGNQVTNNGRLTNTARLIVRGSIGTTENFMRIGHSLLALLAAFAGGLHSRRLYGKERERMEGSVIPETSNSGSSGD